MWLQHFANERHSNEVKVNIYNVGGQLCFHPVYRMTDKATADQFAKVLIQLSGSGKLKKAANLLERQAKPCNAQEESKKENPRACNGYIVFCIFPEICY